MADRVVELFEPVPDGYYLDATLGGGGHALRVARARPSLQIVGFDRDTAALDAAAVTLGGLGPRVTLVHERFDAMRSVVTQGGLTPVSGVLFDLGVSSPQLDIPERGFSYREAGPLDMRMDTTASFSADDVVNGYAPAALRAVIAGFSDERFAHRIASRIVDNRPIRDTAQLANVVRDAIPAAKRRTGGHPAKRTFQAIRMEVNSELEVLERALSEAIDLLAPGGRCVVLSYHSGEDRIVKRTFVEASTGGCRCPAALGCACGAVPTVRLVTRGAERPADDEIAANRRARPARLRCVERLASEPASSTGVGSTGVGSTGVYR